MSAIPDPFVPDYQEHTSLDEAIKLENQLCFSLYAASRAITRLYRPILSPHGLTYPQYLVLMVLWEYNSQPVSDLGRRLFLDSGTLTPLLKRLETLGYIRRHREPSDERKVIIHPTEKAWKFKETALKIPELMAGSLKITLEEIMEIKNKVDYLFQHISQGEESKPGLNED